MSKEFKVKDVKLTMDNTFMMLWAVVLVAVLIVSILGQFLTTVLLCVAIVAFINKQGKASEKDSDTKK